MKENWLKEGKKSKAPEQAYNKNLGASHWSNPLWDYSQQ